MKFFERTDFFQYSWDQVALAFWFRYPNPYSSHVQTEDVLVRKVENGKLYSKRLLTKSIKIPLFGRKIVIKNEPIVEESIIDSNQKRIITYTWNFGSKTTVIEEKCIYVQSDENTTAIERKAWISSGQSYLAMLVENYICKKIRKTMNQTCLGLQYVLESLYLPVSPKNKISIVNNNEKLREKLKKITESRPRPLLTA